MPIALPPVALIKQITIFWVQIFNFARRYRRVAGTAQWRVNENSARALLNPVRKMEIEPHATGRRLMIVTPSDICCRPKTSKFTGPWLKRSIGRPYNILLLRNKGEHIMRENENEIIVIIMKISVSWGEMWRHFRRIKYDSRCLQGEKNTPLTFYRVRLNQIDLSSGDSTTPSS